MGTLSLEMSKPKLDEQFGLVEGVPAHEGVGTR